MRVERCVVSMMLARAIAMSNAIKILFKCETARFIVDVCIYENVSMQCARKTMGKRPRSRGNYTHIWTRQERSHFRWQFATAKQFVIPSTLCFELWFFIVHIVMNVFQTLLCYLLLLAFFSVHRNLCPRLRYVYYVIKFYWIKRR